MNVYSDKKHKPRYWVAGRGKVLFESEDAAEALQWAINHASQIFIEVDFQIKGEIRR